MTDQEILDTIAALLRSRLPATTKEPTMETELKGYLVHPWNFGDMHDKPTVKSFCENPRNWSMTYSDMSEGQQGMVRGLRLYMDAFKDGIKIKPMRKKRNAR